MKLQWRGREYEFIPRSIRPKKDISARLENIGATIYGFDTESVDCGDRYEAQSIQLSGPDGDHFIWLPERENGLKALIDLFVRKYSWKEFGNKNVFMYAHNLIYDFGQLIKSFPDLIAMVQTGIGPDTDYCIYTTADYSVILKPDALLTGNAPFFDIEVRATKREKVVLCFRDTFSFFPASLKSIAVDMKLNVLKEERADDLGRRDFRKEGDSPAKRDFITYATMDAKITRLVGEKIRDLHLSFEMGRIRVSAPSFAISAFYHNLPEDIVMVTGSDKVDIMSAVLDSYAGGRTGGIYQGEVRDITIFDFVSSYPSSMTSIPSFTDKMKYMEWPNPEKMSEHDLMEILNEHAAVLVMDGFESDPKYPALIHATAGRLNPVFGPFSELAVTGVEAYVGIKSGSLALHRLRKLIVLYDPPKTFKPFREFARAAFQRKVDSEKGSPEYISAKLILNSTYGKLIESRSECFVATTAADCVLPYVEELKREMGMLYYKEYLDWLAFGRLNGRTFAQYITPCGESVYKNWPADQIKAATLNHLSLIDLSYGRYAIPAAASQITAISRARLLAVMKATGALYWDTDSVFVPDSVAADIVERLKIANSYLPDYVLPIKVGRNLGDLDREMEHAFGYLAGIKRYCLIDQSGHMKRALHALPTVPFDQAAEIIKKLATGQNVKYSGRAKPLTVREAESADHIGRFVGKDYESLFALDPRLDWKRSPVGWKGEVRPFYEIADGINGIPDPE